jgi:hypothetical protein
MKNVRLYRPVGANELMLIVQSGMKFFPPRLFWQPIFYPVLNIQYAIDIAEGWNMRDPDSNGAGFVTSFEIPECYFMKFPVQTVGLDHHQELWVPAEELVEFNSMIVNGIAVERAFIGKQFNVPQAIKDVLPDYVTLVS